MNHSIRVMRLVPQQPDIPFAFGAVRHAPWNHLERFCTDGLAAIVPRVRVFAHDRDRHCDRGSDQALRFCRSLAASRPTIPCPIPVTFDPLGRNWRARRARKRQVATAIDRLASDA
ncbi:hypothetical protein CK231_10880 [Mesorhizobium loti]|nr:hypothetical protein CK231_10880 [Mesorhizobium loti]PBC07312.1 hypothetical protein CK230_26920 [Mesorhizobium sp. WSM3859]